MSHALRASTLDSVVIISGTQSLRSEYPVLFCRIIRLPVKTCPDTFLIGMVWTPCLLLGFLSIDYRLTSSRAFDRA